MSAARLFHFKKVEKAGRTLYTNTEKSIEIRESWFRAVGEACEDTDSVNVSVLEGKIGSFKVHPREEVQVTGKFHGPEYSNHDFQITCPSEELCRSNLTILLKDILGARAKPVVAALCDVGGVDMSGTLRAAGCTVSRHDVQDEDDKIEITQKEQSRSGPGCTIS